MTKHMEDEGADDGGTDAAGGGGIEGEPTGDGGSVWKLGFGYRRSEEAADHEAELAGVGGGGDSAGDDDEGYVERKD